MTEAVNVEYDIAVSFAGEQRAYVRDTVKACKVLGLRVFFDEDKTNEWWGKNFLVEQRRAYSSQARFFVPFLSVQYVAKPIPLDEFSTAMFRAVEQGDDYILPVLMDDADIPAELLPKSVGYLRAKNYSPQGLAEELRKKVASAKSQGQETPQIAKIVEDAFEVELPRITPPTFSTYAEIDKVLDLLRAYFEAGAERLRSQGLAPYLSGDAQHIMFRVEHGGRTVAGINIRKGGGISEDGISWLVGYSNFSSNSFNGWAKPVFDLERGLAVIELNDFDLGSSGSSFDGSYESFAKLLWSKVIRQIETSVG